ncbi:MAG: glycosyltransferase family 4 protein [Solirubrobacteraceae bacterium]|nr:glycosyltransferase family 4 protein [Solirubrobacteraceae bacterium]
MSAPRPRTVLYLHSSAGRYGADRQLTTIVDGLDRAAFRPLVVLAEDGPLVDDLRDAGADVLVRPLAVLRREVLSPTGLVGLGRALGADVRALGRVVADHDVRLVHTNTSVTLGGAAVARRAGIPHVWHVREDYAGFARGWPALRRLLLTADALPCVSEAVRAQFDGTRRSSRATVIHDGLGDVGPAVARDEARRSLGLADDAFVVAVLGRISPWKGQRLLVEALGDPALRDAPDVVALVAGEAWRRAPGPPAELRRRAAELGVADRVLLPGFVEPVGRVYGAADVVVVPSTDPDPLPNAALEAARAGCCVVAADHGGLPEILDGGRLGVLVPPRDPAALAGALAALRRDPERRIALGAAAGEATPRRFSAARMAARIDALYRTVLDH